MSTNSRIGILNEDGSVISIYCHWDGYPSHNGKILFESYNTPEKIYALMELGDLSSLGEEIGEKHDFNERPEGVCTAYGRDRDESDVEPRTYKNEQDFYANGQEYNYLFKDGKWHVRGRRLNCELSPLIIEKD